MLCFLESPRLRVGASLFLIPAQVVGQIIRTVGSKGQPANIEHTCDKPFIFNSKHTHMFIIKLLHEGPRPRAWE